LLSAAKKPAVSSYSKAAQEFGGLEKEKIDKLEAIQATLQQLLAVKQTMQTRFVVKQLLLNVLLSAKKNSYERNNTKTPLPIQFTLLHILNTLFFNKLPYAATFILFYA
jgi:hypothetical protein